MAAGLNNYFNIDFYWRGANNLAMIVNPAKSQQFGSGITNLNQLKEFIKATFYLDDVIAFQANKDGVNYHGFWGTVIAGGANEKMHRENRWLEIYGDTAIGQRKHTFNDAGLNTYAFSNVDKLITRWANNMKFTGSYKSSYFSASTEYGLSFKRVGETVWQNMPVNAMIDLPQRSQRNLTTRIDTGFEFGDNVTIKPYIINEEGYKSGNEITFAADERVNIFLASKRATPCTTEQAMSPVWMKESQFNGLDTVTTVDRNTGIFLYTNDELSIKIDPGFYVNLDGGSKVFKVDNSGQVVSYQVCTTPPPQKIVTLTLLYSPEDSRITIFVTMSRKFSVPLVISGRVQPYIGSFTAGAYESFDITVDAGSTSAIHPTLFVRDPSLSYRFEAVFSTPSTADSVLIDFKLNNI